MAVRYTIILFLRNLISVYCGAQLDSENINANRNCSTGTGPHMVVSLDIESSISMVSPNPCCLATVLSFC